MNLSLLMVLMRQLAVGVCGVEGRLKQQITSMLEQIDVIDEYDALGEKLDAGVPIQMVCRQCHDFLL